MVRSQLVLPDHTSPTEAETVLTAAGFIQRALDKTWNSPGFSNTALLSLVSWRIPSMWPVAGSEPRGLGWWDEGREVESGAAAQRGARMEELCRRLGRAAGSRCSTRLRMDLSSSSCLRKCLFSPLRVFNWRETRGRH